MASANIESDSVGHGEAADQSLSKTKEASDRKKLPSNDARLLAANDKNDVTDKQFTTGRDLQVPEVDDFLPAIDVTELQSGSRRRTAEAMKAANPLLYRKLHPEEASKEEKAAMMIQKVFRGHIGRKEYLEALREKFNRDEAERYQRELQLIEDTERLLARQELKTQYVERQNISKAAEHRLVYHATRIQRWYRKTKGMPSPEIYRLIDMPEQPTTTTTHPQDASLVDGNETTQGNLKYESGDEGSGREMLDRTNEILLSIHNPDNIPRPSDNREENVPDDLKEGQQAIDSQQLEFITESEVSIVGGDNNGEVLPPPPPLRRKAPRRRKKPVVNEEKPQKSQETCTNLCVIERRPGSNHIAPYEGFAESVVTRAHGALSSTKGNFGDISNGMGHWTSEKLSVLSSKDLVRLATQLNEKINFKGKQLTQELLARDELQHTKQELDAQITAAATKIHSMAGYEANLSVQASPMKMRHGKPR